MSRALTYCLLLIPAITSGQLTYFDRTYDWGNQWESMHSVTALNDGYITAGFCMNLSFERCLLITRVDFNGDTLWSRHYGKPGFDYNGRWLERTVDSCFIITGALKDKSTGDNQFMLVKVNDVGDTLFMRQYGTPSSSDIPKKVIQTADGGFAIVGSRDSNDIYKIQIMLVKTDNDGNEVWRAYYGGGGYENSYSIIELPDSSYVVCGYTGPSTNLNAYALWIGRDGALLNQKSYGGSGTESALAVIQESNGELMFAGFKQTAGSGTTTIQDDTYLLWLWRTDSTGGKYWEHLYGDDVPQFECAPWIMERLPNGDYVIAGSIERNLGNDVGLLMKVDYLGDLKWWREFEHSLTEHNYTYDFKPTPDGGFIICGSTWNATQDAWLIKVDSFGCDTPGCQTADTTGIEAPWSATDKVTVILLPNPMADQSVLQVAAPSPIVGVHVADLQLHLFDQLGREVMPPMLKSTGATGFAEFIIRRGNMSAGVYWWRLSANDRQLESGALVVE